MSKSCQQSYVRVTFLLTRGKWNATAVTECNYWLRMFMIEPAMASFARRPCFRHFVLPLSTKQAQNELGTNSHVGQPSATWRATTNPETKMIVIKAKPKNAIQFSEKRRLERTESVLVRINLTHEQLLHRVKKIGALNKKVFLFSHDEFPKDIHDIMQEHSNLRKAGNAITLICSDMDEQKETTCKRLSLPKPKDTGRWKNDSTLYSFLQVAKSLVVRFGLTEEAKAFLIILKKREARF